MRPLILLAVLALLAMSAPLKAQDEAKPCPCCSEPYRQFDFWLGDWEAYGPTGNLAGTNHIVLLHGQCVIQENWSSGGGSFTGTSYNYYDAADETWNQTWVDNQGGNLQLKGSWNGAAMVLLSEPATTADGVTSQSRITWTPNEDGTVRQHWELTKDGGLTWSTLFDGLYKLKTD